MASLEARLHLIRASTVGLDVGVDRRISSPSEQADSFSIVFQLSPISRARWRIAKDGTSNSSLRGRSESL
jgi:hypothetical protein